jgi:hypothetical protein
MTIATVTTTDEEIRVADKDNSELAPLPHMQSYIPKPSNLNQLLDSTELEFRQAMDFDDAQFSSMTVSFPLFDIWKPDHDRLPRLFFVG